MVPGVTRRLRPALPILLLIGVGLAAGCRHQSTPVAGAPPPPALGTTPPAGPAPSAPTTPTAVADSTVDGDFVASHPVIYTEEGLASWYGPPYDKRRGANGEIFDKDALTAAHRTLPMNSLIRVTNLSTGQSVIVRVTDRGPFVHDRTLDLSLPPPK